MAKLQRLDKVLANSGFGSRNEIRKLIQKKMITVDGFTPKTSDYKVDVDLNEIIVGGTKLVYREFVYLMMNKPKDVISATFDNIHQTVIDLLPFEYSHFDVAPVGRLDIDTTGLLLLTNDGDLNHNLLSPKKHVTKKYYAQLEENGETIDEAIIQKFTNGIELADGYKCLPATLEVSNNNEVYITITEGKFHQVKRMFKAIGRTVVELERLEMGALILDPNLQPGECRELTQQELNMLKGLE